jgi:signal transduction histidine kinase
MNLNFFKFKYAKMAGLLLLCFVVALALQAVSIPAGDSFFLDWKQILINRAPPANPFTIFNVSGLKTGNEVPHVEEARLFEALNMISQGEPRSIILTLAPDEILTTDIDKLASKLESYPKLLLFYESSRPNTATFFQDKHFINLKNQFSVLLTNDSRLDRVTRRILISYDEDRKKINTDFEVVPKQLGIQFVDPKKIKGDFSYLESRQILMKIWDRKKLNSIDINSLADLEKNSKSIKDRIVFVATNDTFSTASGPSIYYRKEFGGSSIQNSFWTDAELIVTHLINLTSGDYIRTPSKWVDIAWLTAWLFIVMSLLVFSDLRRAIPFSFLGVGLFVGIGLLTYKWFSVDLGFSRGVLASFLIQYFGIPILLLRYLRNEDNQKIENERVLEREKVKSRFVVKAAKADITLQVAARVSHDIRSPLMALQIASSVLKGKVSEDLESLVRDSTARIKHIADDILDTYRGKSKQDFEMAPLDHLVQDLLRSYRQVYPQMIFKTHIDETLKVPIPEYSLQRCLGNLINNSIEALSGVVDPCITLEAIVSAQNEVVLSVKDNGPGVSPENQSRLFQEKATFGKVGGTGLGLYQVRKELELYGGLISYKSGAGGNFEIKIPMDLQQVAFKVSKRVVVLESASEITSLLRNSVSPGIELAACKTVKEAADAIAECVQAGQSWTIFADLVLASDDETGFDILDKVPMKNGQVVLCTSLSDHKDIQEIANRLGAILVNKDLLGRLKLTQ